MAHLDTNDEHLASCCGVWAYELAELTALRRAATSVAQGDEIENNDFGRSLFGGEAEMQATFSQKASELEALEKGLFVPARFRASRHLKLAGRLHLPSISRSGVVLPWRRRAALAAKESAHVPPLSAPQFGRSVVGGDL